MHDFEHFQSLVLCEQLIVRKTKVPIVPRNAMQLIGYYRRELDIYGAMKIINAYLGENHKPLLPKSAVNLVIDSDEKMQILKRLNQAAIKLCSELTLNTDHLNELTTIRNLIEAWKKEVQELPSTSHSFLMQMGGGILKCITNLNKTFKALNKKVRFLEILMHVIHLNPDVDVVSLQRGNKYIPCIPLKISELSLYDNSYSSIIELNINVSEANDLVSFLNNYFKDRTLCSLHYRSELFNDYPDSDPDSDSDSDQGEEFGRFNSTYLVFPKLKDGQALKEKLNELVELADSRPQMNISKFVSSSADSSAESSSWFKCSIL